LAVDLNKKHLLNATMSEVARRPSWKKRPAAG
jgi:hypothetical protein